MLPGLVDLLAGVAGGVELEEELQDALGRAMDGGDAGEPALRHVADEDAGELAKQVGKRADDALGLIEGQVGLVVAEGRDKEFRFEPLFLGGTPGAFVHEGGIFAAEAFSLTGMALRRFQQRHRPLEVVAVHGEDGPLGGGLDLLRLADEGAAHLLARDEALAHGLQGGKRGEHMRAWYGVWRQASRVDGMADACLDQRRKEARMRDWKKIEERIGEDVQVGRLLSLACDVPETERIKFIKEAFHHCGATLRLGEDLEAFLQRVRRHPKYDACLQPIGEDEQARRIAERIGKVPLPAFETAAQQYFKAANGRLGRSYAAFRERLEPFRDKGVGEAPSPEGTPISRLLELVSTPTNRRTARVVEQTGCTTIEALVERYSEWQLRALDGCGKTTLALLRNQLQALGFTLRKK